MFWPGVPQPSFSQLHLAVRGVEAWRAARGGAPPPLRDDAAVAECVARAKEAASDATPGAHFSFKQGMAGAVSGAVNEAVVARVAALAGSELPALCAILGGVIAHEVFKATGKGTPLGGCAALDPVMFANDNTSAQLAFFDAMDVFAPPADPAAAPAARAPPEEFAAPPALGRYADSIAILGNTVQRSVMSARVFLVGMGALGCELLKNFALAGVACDGGRGALTVTDMDTVSLSNLSRQFLFRDKHINKLKSESAREAALRMNPALPLATRADPVEAPSFDGRFWAGLDVCVLALDKHAPRRFCVERGTEFGFPVLNSATEGDNGSTEQFLPPKGKGVYEGSDNDALGAIPACTIKSTPFAIEHCVVFVKMLMFANPFTAAPKLLKALLDAPKRASLSPSLRRAGTAAGAPRRSAPRARGRSPAPRARSPAGRRGCNSRRGTARAALPP